MISRTIGFENLQLNISNIQFIMKVLRNIKKAFKLREHFSTAFSYNEISENATICLKYLKNAHNFIPANIVIKTFP